jgi:hypothetical protein
MALFSQRKGIRPSGERGYWSASLPERLDFRLSAQADYSVERMAEGPIQPINVTFHCNACGGQRNHAVLTEHVHEWNEELHYYDESDNLSGIHLRRKDVYTLLQCCGCGSVSLKHELFPEEDEDSTIKTYPPRQFRQMPAWVQEIEWKGDADPFAFIPRLLKGNLWIASFRTSRCSCFGHTGIARISNDREDRR